MTEEWLQDEREVFRERLPAAGFWSFDNVLGNRMNGRYFKQATDKRAYIHGQLESAAERWREERNNGNGRTRTGVVQQRPDDEDPIEKRLRLDAEREARQLGVS